MFSKLYALLFPTRCAVCCLGGSALCDRCLSSIRFAQDLPDHTLAVYDYGQSVVKRAIRQFKYYRRSETVRTLATAAAPYIEEFLAGEIQSESAQRMILIPIPEHPRKLRVKGFNQSVLLAKWWSKLLPGSRVQELLHKTVFTMPQAHLGRTARMKNVSHTMEVLGILDPKAIYLIIDDVTTTGATFAEARRALRAAGAKKIFCIALAHGYASR